MFRVKISIEIVSIHFNRLRCIAVHFVAYLSMDIPLWMSLLSLRRVNKYNCVPKSMRWQSDGCFTYGFCIYYRPVHIHMHAFRWNQWNLWIIFIRDKSLHMYTIPIYNFTICIYANPFNNFMAWINFFFRKKKNQQHSDKWTFVQTLISTEVFIRRPNDKEWIVLVCTIMNNVKNIARNSKFNNIFRVQLQHHNGPIKLMIMNCAKWLALVQRQLCMLPIVSRARKNVQ